LQYQKFLHVGDGKPIFDGGLERAMSGPTQITNCGPAKGSGLLSKKRLSEKTDMNNIMEYYFIRFLKKCEIISVSFNYHYLTAF